MSPANGAQVVAEHILGQESQSGASVTLTLGAAPVCSHGSIDILKSPTFSARAATGTSSTESPAYRHGQEQPTPEPLQQLQQGEA